MPLAIRQLEPELMDNPALDQTPHVEALRGLARLNRVSRSARILWQPLRELARRTPRPLRVLDIATGAGDIPITLWHQARREGLSLNLDGCDRSATAIEHARQQAQRARVPVGWHVRNALLDTLPQDYDVITCSLFLHHLGDLEAVELLKRLGRAAGRMLLVHDLIRSPAGLALAWLGSRTLTRSSIVRNDAMQSVRAAFTVEEIHLFARLAGLEGYQLVRRWPSRFLLIWRRA